MSFFPALKMNVRIIRTAVQFPVLAELSFRQEQMKYPPVSFHLLMTLIKDFVVALRPNAAVLHEAL